jgi:hypothetical protein
VKVCGVLVLFDGAECSVSPIGDSVELSERIDQFCKAALADPTISDCLSGLHQHQAGTCALRAGVAC